MRKLSILTVLLVLTGSAAALPTPQIPVNNDVAPEPSQEIEKPDVDTGFETGLEYSYQSNLVDFNTSESIETNPVKLKNYTETGDNETSERPEEPDQNETDAETGEASSSSSSSRSSDYSTPSINVEPSRDNSTNNEPSEDSNSSDNETEQDIENSSNGTEETSTAGRDTPRVFEGPWQNIKDISGSDSSLEFATGKFSQSETLGVAAALLFACLTASKYV